MMPAGAAESRGKQKSVLAGVVYEKALPFSCGLPFLAGPHKLEGPNKASHTAF